MKRFEKWILRGLILFIGLIWVWLVADALVAAVHVRWGLCPLHFARFTPSQVIPVIYGEPTGETFERARRGEVTLGGCVMGPVAAFCPYCSYPARFRPQTPPALILDRVTLKGLSAEESRAIRRYVADIVGRTSCDSEEWVTAILTTPDDVWLGTLESGLHRFDRKAAQWQSYEGTNTGWRISRIRQINHGIGVESDVTGFGLFYENYTEDRGKTWKRL